MQSTCSRASSRLGFPYDALTGLTPVERIEVVRAYLDAALTRAADIHASRDHHHEGGGRMSATTPTTHPGHTNPATHATALAAPATPSGGGLVPFVFDGLQVRALTRDGEPWFVAADIARALDYRDAFNFMRGLDEDEKGTHIVSTPSGDQEMTVISEPGLYQVLVRSRAERTRPFRRWVTHEVLPALRRDGAYVVVPRSLPEALRAYAAEVEAHGRSRAELEAARPKVEAFESLVSASGDWSVAQAAKVLARDHGIVTGPTRLWRFLEEARWVFRSGSGALVAMQAQVDAGRLTSRAQSHVNPASGRRVVDAPQVRVTPTGLEALRLLLLGARAEQGVGA